MKKTKSNNDFHALITLGTKIYGLHLMNGMSIYVYSRDYEDKKIESRIKYDFLHIGKLKTAFCYLINILSRCK